MRLNTTFEHLTGGWEIGRCLISRVYCNMCVWCVCMCTCMHICLCLYSFVCVLSFVKQQMLKNSETVPVVALARATAYQAGRPSVLRL